MAKHFIFCFLSLFATFISQAQLPTPAIVGYWESWNAKKLNLKDIDSRYNVIHVSFAELNPLKDYDVSYSAPLGYTEEVFKNEVAALQAEGKKVIISLGGQNDHVMLDSLAEKNAFVASMNAMVDYWGFDGIDIDLEGSSLNFDNINVQSPGDQRQQLMITAIKEIMHNHWTTHNKKLILTMAPETIYVQGALSKWAGKYKGAYLPIIEALRDSIDMLNVQLYNSGSMYSLDGQAGGEFTQGNADFVLAMTEAVITGFTATSDIGDYSGFDASKIGVALPGCHSSDAVPHKELEQAIKYLMGKGPQPGQYKLKKEGGFPEIKGMMTWSINSDRGCDPSYGFVDTWGKLFTDSSYIEISNVEDIYEQEEDGKKIAVNLFKNKFKSKLDTGKWTLNNLPDGVVIDSLLLVNDSVVHVLLKGSSAVKYDAAKWNVKVTVDSSEFTKYTLPLSRGNGVVLKKTRTVIPGLLQGEDLFAKKSAYVRDLFDGEGKMIRYNKGYSSDYEIDVTKTGNYDFEFRAASASGSHSIQLAVDGESKGSHTFSTSSGWTVMETVQFNAISLDSGHHVLQVKMKSGWLHWDWMDFEEASPDTTNGMNESENLTEIYLFPNPTTGVFQSNEHLVNAKLWSFDGQLIRQWNHASLFNVSGVARGTYLITADGYQGKIVIK